MENSKKPIIYWLNFSLVTLIAMICIGGVTRLTQSGLSIVSWKPIVGTLPPLSEIQWNNEFNSYKKFPEYKNLNFDMTLSEYKKIYYWEYSHRLLGRFIGILFIFPFIYFYYKKYLNKKLIVKLFLVFILGFIQGLVGWYMVKSGLINVPHVSHYRLALHLLIAFILIGSVYWIKLSILFDEEKKIDKYLSTNSFLNIIVVLVFIQILYGAFSAGITTGQHWNTFPLINGNFFPGDVLSLEPLWINFIKNSTTIQFIHRYLGIIIFILISIFCYKFKNNTVNNNNLKHVFILVFCQILLGMLSVISNIAIPFVLLHQIVASLLLIYLLKIKHSIRFNHFN